MQERHPTAQRIIDVALALFAEHGMGATPIVRIEEAAGLAPGSGGFYKHFKSKGEILRAARQDMAAVLPSAEIDELLRDMDLEAQLRLIAEGMLTSYDTQRNLVLAGLRLPPDHGLFDNTDSSIGAGGIDWFEYWLTERQSDGDIRTEDPRATAIVLFGSLFSYWLSGQLSTSGTLGVDRQRLIDAWTRTATAALHARGSGT